MCSRNINNMPSLYIRLNALIRHRNNFVCLVRIRTKTAMHSEAAVAGMKAFQAALKVIVALQLTAYMWPQHADIKDGGSFDFIVVGAGTAGSVVANRLTENPNINVLLIEAGGDPPLESILPLTLLLLKRSYADWSYESENNKYIEQCHQNPFFEMTLGKMLGGSSSLSYLNYGRGLPQDYNSWAIAANDSTWEWSNVIEYFKKSEKLDDPEILQSPDNDFHGTNGYLGVVKDSSNDAKVFLNAFKELGHDVHLDLNERHPIGYSELMLMIANGDRQSTAISYLRPIKDRPNLHVMKNTQVTKIIFDENKNAVGVQALTYDGKTINLKATNEVIISAGVFNTPKLLMLSGIGPKAHLEDKNIPVISDVPVGQNLRDHVAISIIHKLTDIKDPRLPVNPHVNPAPQILGHVAFNKSQLLPDYLTLSFLTEPETIVRFCSFAYRYSHEICNKLYEDINGKKIIFHQIIKPHPKSRGTVSLRSSDPADSPIIETGYWSHEDDLNDVIRYVDDFSVLVNTTYFKSVHAKMVDPTGSRCSSYPLGSKEYWRCYSSCMLSGMSHYSGTCAMGSVVDGKLRVRGVQKLRVADASIMPTMPSSNPIPSIIMIGEKIADFLKHDY